MSLRVWLPLNGDLRNQGISNIEVINNNAMINNNGKIGKCYQFGTTSSDISISKEAMTSFTNECSVSFWLNILTWNTSYATYFQAGLASAPWTSYIFGFLRRNANSNCCFTISNGNTASNDSYATSTLNLNTWYHISLIYKTGKCQIYLNGSLDHEYNTSIVPDFTKITTIKIGKCTNGTSYQTNCLLNDFRIYDHALSVVEIKEIAQGLILHYPFNDEYIESVKNLCTTNTLGNNAYNGATGKYSYGTTTDMYKTIITRQDCGECTQVKMGTAGLSAYPYVWFDNIHPRQNEYRTLSFDYYPTSQTSVVFYTYSGSATATHTVNYGPTQTGSTIPVILNQWNHITLTLLGTSTNTAGWGYMRIGSSAHTSTTTDYWLFNNIQVEINDHATPYTINERGSNNINISSANLITSLTAGGRTTVSGNTVTTAGTDADTYFYINLSTPMIKNHLYKISCNVSGLAAEGYWNFPIASQSNNTIPAFRLVNGYNELIFRANDTCVSAGTKVILDDNGATSRTVTMTANNFKLIDITPIIYDNSGYGNNGILIGEFTMKDSPRYNKCLYLNSSSPTTSDEKGICYIQAPFSLTTPSQMTIAWWAKPESGYGSGAGHAAFCTSNLDTQPTDYNTTAFHHRDNGFDIYPSDGSGVKRLNFTYTLNQWHHYAVTYDGTTARAYQDGELKSSIEVGANKTLASFSQLYIGFSRAGGVWRKTKGSYSDFRIYCTPLLDTDIKSLYNVGMKIDNQYNVHAFEMIEREVNKINKYGQVQFSTIYENGLIEKLHYDKTIYTEPDGSTWVRVFHHNDPTTSGLFVKASDWEHGVYENADKWYDIEQIIPLLIKYEFMVKQKTTSSANEAKYRWIQTANPLTCVYNDVSPGNITVNTSTGYTNSSQGGLWKMNSSARMCIANSSSGNWYGAMGSWSVYNTNNVPGYPNSNISTGYLDFYVRVYSKIKDIKNYGLTANQFIER